MESGPPEPSVGTHPSTAPASDPSSAIATENGNDDLIPLDPRVRTLWWITGAAFVAFVGLLVAMVDLFAPLPLRRGLPTAAVLTVGALLGAIVPVLRYRRWRYALRPKDLWIRHGVLWVTVSVIPFSRLQFVDTRQGPLDRLFGLSQLVVHTAALGTSGRLPGLDTAEAERLRERLAEVEPSHDASV